MVVTIPDEGWAWVTLAGSFGEHAVMGYCMYASGMLLIALIEQFKASLLTTSWITALFLCMNSSSGPIASILINRYSCRVAMIVGSFLMTLGFVLTAVVEQVELTFLTFSMIAGVGLGICYNTGMIVVAFNFERKRNLAAGIATSGGGIGPFILTPVFQIIYNYYKFTGFCLLLGGLSLQNCVFGFLFRPSTLEIKMKAINRRRHKQSFKESIADYMEIVRSGSMLCLCLSYFFANISIFLLYTHFPEYCLQTHSTKMEISYFLSIAGISGCVGRLLFGMANNSHDIKEIVMLFGVFTMLGLGTMLFPFASQYTAAKIIFASFLGAYSGCCYPILNSVVIETVGHSMLAHGVGYLMLFIGIGTFIGPPLAGFIVSYGGTYGFSFVVAGILLICGGLFSLLSTICRGEIEDENKITDFEFSVQPDVDEKKEMVSVIQ